MIIKTSEKGQALILVTLAAVGLFAFAALAIDGSMAFSDKRHAQNAADAAALAGALTYTRGGDDTAISTIAQTRSTTNGYDNNGASNIVTITATDVPPGECPGGTEGKDITVQIVSYVDTTFAKVVGREQIENAVTATSRACGFYYQPLFNGNAIVGLNDATPCGFDTGNSSSVKWKVKGGGIFSNGCGWSKDYDSVTFVDPGTCISTVDGVAGGSKWSCTPSETEAYTWADYVQEIMPPNPCDGTPGDIGKPADDDNPNFKDGVYCINDFDDFAKKNITLDNATLYVTDDKFSLNFSGGGGFFGTATKAGTYTGSDDYAGFFLVVKPSATFCTKFSDNHAQVLEWRGNGSGTFYGTVLAPSACIDLRGNGSAEGMHSQVIGWLVSSNGTADIYVNYKAEENRQIPVFPSITVLE